jgi:hypothetical protein
LSSAAAHGRRHPRETDEQTAVGTGQHVAAGGVATDAFKGVARVDPVLEVWRRDIHPIESAFRVGLPQDDEAVWIRIRQRAEQHAVDHAEDGRVRADTNRQRQNAAQREAWPLPQRADGHPKVSQKGRKHVD